MRAINITEFCHDILSSSLITQPPSTLSAIILLSLSLSLSLSTFRQTCTSKSNIIRTKHRNTWLTQALKTLKFANRQPERIWSRTRSSLDLKNLRSATNHYHAAMIKAKRTYNSSLISSSSLILVKFGKISIYFLIAFLRLLYTLMTLNASCLNNVLNSSLIYLHISLLINLISASPHFPPPFTPPNFSSSIIIVCIPLMKFLSSSLNLLALIVI